MVGEATNNALLLALKQRISGPGPDAGQRLKNFGPAEFACPCGCGLDVVWPLKELAQALRDAFGWPLVISSGGRCPPENEAVGGVPDSCHLSGEAFDCYFPGQMNEAVMAAMADLAIRRGFGVIRYPQRRFCHFQIPLRNDLGE